MIQKINQRQNINSTSEIIIAFKMTPFILPFQQVPNLFFIPLSDVIPPPLHQGTRVIERIDNSMFPLGAKLYLIQF